MRLLAALLFALALLLPGGSAVAAGLTEFPVSELRDAERDEPRMPGEGAGESATDPQDRCGGPPCPARPPHALPRPPAPPAYQQPLLACPERPPRFG